jgi:hypothetical protein
MENKEFYSVFPEFIFEVFEKPLELISHSNFVSMNALNIVTANAIKRSKLREAGFVKHDIFSSSAVVEKFRALMIFYLPYVMFLIMFVILVLLKYL